MYMFDVCVCVCVLACVCMCVCVRESHNVCLDIYECVYRV